MPLINFSPFSNKDLARTPSSSNGFGVSNVFSVLNNNSIQLSPTYVGSIATDDPNVISSSTGEVLNGQTIRITEIVTGGLPTNIFTQTSYKLSIIEGTQTAGLRSNKYQEANIIFTSPANCTFNFVYVYNTSSNGIYGGVFEDCSLLRVFLPLVGVGALTTADGSNRYQYGSVWCPDVAAMVYGSNPRNTALETGKVEGQALPQYVSLKEVIKEDISNVPTMSLPARTYPYEIPCKLVYVSPLTNSANFGFNTSLSNHLTGFGYAGAAVTAGTPNMSESRSIGYLGYNDIGSSSRYRTNSVSNVGGFPPQDIVLGVIPLETLTPDSNYVLDIEFNMPAIQLQPNAAS